MSKAQLRTRFYVICVWCGVAWRFERTNTRTQKECACVVSTKFLVSAIRRNEERVTVKESAIDRLTAKSSS